MSPSVHVWGTPHHSTAMRRSVKIISTKLKQIRNRVLQNNRDIRKLRKHSSAIRREYFAQLCSEPWSSCAVILHGNMTDQWCPSPDILRFKFNAILDESCASVFVSVCWSHGPSVTVLMLIAVALRADWARPPALTQMAHLQMQQALICRAAKWALRYSTSCLPSQPFTLPLSLPHSPLSNSLFLPLSPHFLPFTLISVSLLFYLKWFSTCLSITVFHSHCFSTSFFLRSFLHSNAPSILHRNTSFPSITNRFGIHLL